MPTTMTTRALNTTPVSEIGTLYASLFGHERVEVERICHDGLCLCDYIITVAGSAVASAGGPDIMADDELADRIHAAMRD